MISGHLLYPCNLCAILYFGTPSRLFPRWSKNPIQNEECSLVGWETIQRQTFAYSDILCTFVQKQMV